MDFIFLKTFKDFKDPWGPCTINCTLSSINDHNTESLWLNISSSSDSLLLGVCYRPELAGTTYVENLCKCFNDLPHTTDAIIVGDFNFRDI